MVIQPVLGFLHHSHYKKYTARGAVSYVHIWYGRILIALGIINGGLGLQLAHAPTAFTAVYIVLTIIVTIFYLLFQFVGLSRRRRAEKQSFQSVDEPRELRSLRK